MLCAHACAPAGVRAAFTDAASVRSIMIPRPVRATAAFLPPRLNQPTTWLQHLLHLPGSVRITGCHGCPETSHCLARIREQRIIPPHVSFTVSLSPKATGRHLEYTAYCGGVVGLI